MRDRNPAAGGGRRGRRKQPFLYSFGSNLLPRVGRRFGTTFKAIQLLGSEQYLLRGPDRLALGPTLCFQEKPQGCDPKSSQIVDAGSEPGILH